MITDRKIVAVLGMMCSACAANVEKKLNGMNGVLQASVNLPGRTVMVEYDKDRTSLQHMKEALGAIGYDMVVEEDRNVEAIERRGYVALRRKVILSWTFALLVMAFSLQLLHARQTVSKLQERLSALEAEVEQLRAFRDETMRRAADREDAMASFRKSVRRALEAQAGAARDLQEVAAAMDVALGLPPAP